MGETGRTKPGEGPAQAQLLEDLRRRASKDALSGLLNRAAMEHCIRERLEAMGPEDTCALFIVDLDNFKQVNDTLGHQAGDQAIRQSAKILSGLFRASDIVGRLGGDEFAVFLCGRITEALAREKAAAICQHLTLALGDEHASVNVTASVGVHLAGRGQKFEGLYQSADLALYKAKKAGKHGFCLKSPGGQGEDFQPVNTISLSGLLEQMESGVALLEMGEAPQVIYVSPSFCRIIGGGADDFPLPLPLSQLIHPDDLASLVQALREGLRHGQVVEHTHRVRGWDGKGWLWWQVRAVHIEYDSPDPVMLITAVDVSRFKETEQRQEEQIRRLQAAFDQTSKRLWEVELATGAFRLYRREGNYRTVEDTVKHFPDDLIHGGWLHPSSAGRFRDFARELMGGCVQGFGNFAVRSRDTGYYSWVSISYRMLFDDVGRPARAVGVLEDLARSFADQGSWSPDQQLLPEGLAADLVMRMRADLDQDTVEALWMEGADLSGQVRETRCSQFLRLEKHNVFARADRQNFPACFDREQLLQMYRSGQRWLCVEYRRVDGGGSIRWVRHVLYLTEDPLSRHVYLFIYLIWLDPENRLKQVIRSQAGRDEVSRLFDREAIHRMADALFSTRKNGNRAVAVLQTNGLERAQQPEAHRMRYAIAAGLSLALGGSCLLGQYSAHQIVIVFPSVTEREELRRRVEEAVAFLRRLLAAEPPFDSLRFLVGIDLMPAATANYGPMLAQAVRVCGFWWNAAADTVAFSQEREDWGWPQPQDTEDQVSVHSAEMARPLSEQEKDVALDCVSAMLSARTLDASISGVLQAIGAYYRADRAYTLLLAENRRTVVMTFEWTSPSKSSIQQAVSGMQLERFPLLRRCLAEQAPIFVTRRLPPGQGGGKERLWHFTAFPLIRERRVTGFLCIENAREHPADAALFSTLIPLMLQQRERFSGGERPSATMEQLMGLPDMRAFQETVYTLTSEHYSSLGALCLDIPGLADINARQGFEYGSRMLWYVAKSLTDLFGAALLFRTWDAEFVVFHPNTTREVFLGRCGRLRSILQRRYPKQVRMGRAWSDGVFTGGRLAKEAKAAMQRERAGPSGGAQLPIPVGRGAGVPVHEDRFTIYFQPKVDMRTGALTGTEALVRGVGEDGSIIPPSQFIELLEEAGTIRDLDLFVLERALAQAEQWRSSGLGVVPVAVNLSRVTLGHPSTLASVLAIQSRYPELPPAALELEITERGGELETSELREIVERFHACGLRLSLDDFGSQYANLPLFTNVKFDTVKLDRSLITGVVSNPINRTLVQDIVQICRTYGMACVAEGVEQEEQIAALLEMGCVYAQGFYYDKPLPAQAFEEKYLRGGTAPEQERTEKEEEHT